MPKRKEPASEIRAAARKFRRIHRELLRIRFPSAAPLILLAEEPANVGHPIRDPDWPVHLIRAIRRLKDPAKFTNSAIANLILKDDAAADIVVPTKGELKPSARALRRAIAALIDLAAARLQIDRDKIRSERRRIFDLILWKNQI